MTRVLVCGGRGYADQVTLFAEMDRLDVERGPFTEVIHGAARGADRLAGSWAEARGRRGMGFPAEWDRYGDRAGPIRNRRMLAEGNPDLVIAFPGGRGTDHMVGIAKAAGIEVVQL